MHSLIVNITLTQGQGERDESDSSDDGYAQRGSDTQGSLRYGRLTREETQEGIFFPRRCKKSREHRKACREMITRLKLPVSHRNVLRQRPQLDTWKLLRIKSPNITSCERDRRSLLPTRKWYKVDEVLGIISGSVGGRNER